MKQATTVCDRIEPDLVATAMGEARPGAARRVHEHLGICRGCREAFGRYQAIDGLIAGTREEAVPAEGLAASRGELEARLADLRSRLVAYRVFPSPLGPILIARSEQGVSLVEYLGRGRGLGASRLSLASGVEPVEGGPELEGLHRELIEYLGGRRTHLAWPLDLRLASSDFHRAVLEATAAIPYGAVTSYTHIADEIGRPEATRAVAQALRWNPLPIVVPCHRVVGASGALIGYAGNRLPLKRRLLGVEGVPTLKAADDVRVARQSMYVLGPGDEEYCLPTCPSITPARRARSTFFGSQGRAEAAGMAPCTTCRPDLHPLSR